MPLVRNYVFYKFIGKFLPIVSGIFLILILSSAWFHYTEQKIQLNNKLNTLAAAYSLIFSEPVQNSDQDALDLFVASILADRDVALIKINSAPITKVLADFDEQRHSDSMLLQTQNITMVDEFGIHQVGTITLGLTTEHIRDHAISSLKSGLLSLMLFLFTLLVVGRLAYQSAIGKYLDQLIAAIIHFRQTGEHKNIVSASDDELGAIIKTYNEMQQQQLVDKSDLLEYQSNLQQQVEVRTEALLVELDSHRETEQKLYFEKERIQVVLASIQDVVISIDRDGLVNYMNEKAQQLLGAGEGKPFNELLLLESESREFVQQVQYCLNSRDGKQLELQDRLLLPTKESIDVEVRLAALLDHVEHVSGALVIIRDVTVAKKQKEALVYQATHDSLTKLINRSEFELRLEQAYQLARNEQSVHTLCFLDLDQFKVVNDVAGHRAGDQLLVQLSHILKKHVWKRDVLARIGGDEFAILMEYCDLDAAKTKAESIRRLIEDFRFAWQDRFFSLGVSIGLVRIDNESLGTENILKQADIACYTAKDAGRNRVHVYQFDDEMSVRREGDMYWASQVQASIDKDKLILYVQRIADVNDDDIQIYEVLVRMEADDGKIIPPGVFLPAAERYNLSHKLDRWVIENTLAWIEQHGNHFKNLKYFSINLSGAAIGDEAMLGFIKSKLQKPAFSYADKIMFEITETHAVANLSEASNFINELRALGCKFALDDFGSGLSSFAYLKNLPVDILKIDGVFIKDILDDSIDAAMVKSIIEIGHVMKMKTVAEFVENGGVKSHLKTVNIDYVQGYGIEKPKPIGDLLEH